MRKNQIVICCGTLFFFLWASLVFAQDAQSLFEEANRFYKDGKYAEAIAKYEEILDEGSESGELYYNLGNSYFKEKEPGKALLNYERARFFIANDSDLKSNYLYVRSLLNTGPVCLPGSKFSRWLDKVFEEAGINFMTVILSLLSVVFFAVLIFRMFFAGVRKFEKPLLVVIAVLFFCCGISLVRKINYFNKGAVVIKEKAEARFEPMETATVYFNLSEGNSVEVVGQSSDWYKIRRLDGKLGWVLKESLRLIKEMINV